jgi:hypothetical protein
MLIDAEGRLVKDRSTVVRGRMRILWPRTAAFPSLTFAAMWEVGALQLSWLVVERSTQPAKSETLVPFHPLTPGKTYTFVIVRTNPGQKWDRYKNTYRLGGAWSIHRLAAAFSLGFIELFRVTFSAA